jgi:hypothetical protein
MEIESNNSDYTSAHQPKHISADQFEKSADPVLSLSVLTRPGGREPWSRNDSLVDYGRQGRIAVRPIPEQRRSLAQERKAEQKSQSRSPDALLGL